MLTSVSMQDIDMVPLGYGKFVRGADIVAVVPIEDDERGDRRRTYVYVAGIAMPLIASRSEHAIMRDLRRAAATGTVARTEPGRRPSAADGSRRWHRRLTRGVRAA